MIIIGLSAYHGDSAACLVRDGEIVAAEERFRGIKHWAGFPSEAIRYCLAEAGLSLGDVDIVAINSDPRASLRKKPEFTLLHPASFSAECSLHLVVEGLPARRLAVCAQTHHGRTEGATD